MQSLYEQPFQSPDRNAAAVRDLRDLERLDIVMVDVVEDVTDAGDRENMKFRIPVMIGALLAAVRIFAAPVPADLPRPNQPLLVELLDEEGKVIDGFAKADCAAVKGDGTKLRVEWKDNPTLASLEGKNIKIKFYLDDGDIYAFWISPGQTGESHGYTGGGGPGLDRSGMDINN